MESEAVVKAANDAWMAELDRRVLPEDGIIDFQAVYVATARIRVVRLTKRERLLVTKRLERYGLL